MSEQFGPSEMVEVLQEKVTRLETELAGAEIARNQLIDQHEATLDNAREQHTRVINRQHEEHREMVTRYDARVAELTDTPQGEAVLRMESAEAKAERAQEMVNQYRGRVQQAESDKARALASVEGHDDIHPEDPRVMHIWKKAHRIATSEGFCQEYDKIADGLGIPDIEQEYEGEVTINFSGTVTVPVSGTANRREIADGDIEPNIDTSDIIENIDTYELDWSIESYDITTA